MKLKKNKKNYKINKKLFKITNNIVKFFNKRKLKILQKFKN